MSKIELQQHLRFAKKTAPEPSDIQGHIFTNETLTGTELRKIRERRQQAPGGLGLVIGSGGIFSLLPHLDLDGVIIADRNPAVLSVAKLTGACIAASDTPEAAVDKLFGYLPATAIHDHKALPLSDALDLDGVAKAEFKTEKTGIGRRHWSNEVAFPKAKEAIESTAIGFANRDVTTFDFFIELNDILETTGIPLNYVNFSNIHNWLGGNLRKLRNIAELLNPYATIQFSSYQPQLPYEVSLGVLSTGAFPEYCRRVNYIWE